uniref:7TM GPCR serpentine receptor class x (Srx) domain-containing protein n=1 Tax=Panagrolaimus superbus TaxID=310955 RepID=A0A914YJC0_9BILA
MEGIDGKKQPFIDLRHILEISDGTMSIVGLILNTLLLCLILFKSGERLKEYRRILLLNCIVDIIYNSANTVTRTASF